MVNPSEYIEASILAREVGEQMLARLQWVKFQPNCIAEVGAKTGYCASLLQKQYPQASVFAVDTHYPMLQYLREQDISVQPICADMHALPFSNHSLDVIFANLIASWSDDIPALFREWQRVLKPNGLLMFSCFGPDTLKECREILADITLPHLLDMHNYGDALTKCRYVDPVMDVEYFTLNYRNQEKLFTDLRNTEMIISEHVTMPTFEQQQIPLTTRYEIVYGHAWGPQLHLEQSSDEQGMVKFPLSHLRMRNKT
jgi:malonyl-CoA O-methyltransferase